MQNIKQSLKSVRVKLFLTLSLVILLIITFLIILNNVVLGTFFLYSKTKTLKSVYELTNNYYNNVDSNINIETELEKIAIKNNFDILIRDNQNVNIYTSSKDFFSTLGQMNAMTNILTLNSGEILEQEDEYTIRKIKEEVRKWEPEELRTAICVVNEEKWEKSNKTNYNDEIEYIGKSVRGWVVFPWEV